MTEHTKTEDQFEIFQRLDIRVGKVLSAEPHPDADSLYLETVDVGEPEPRTIISGLRSYVTLDEIVGQSVLVLCNLKPRKMRGILSHGMLLCASTEDHSAVELLTSETDSNPGDRVSLKQLFEKGLVDPDKRLNPKRKYWQKCEPDMGSMTDKDTVVACYRDLILQTESGCRFVCKSLPKFQVG